MTTILSLALSLSTQIPGTDDALAPLLASRSSELQVVGLTPPYQADVIVQDCTELAEALLTPAVCASGRRPQGFPPRKGVDKICSPAYYSSRQ